MTEIWRTPIRRAKSLPMYALPVCIRDTGFPYLLKIFTFDLNRYRQPLGTRTGFNLVTISPIPSRILNIVEKDENVDIVNEVEISLPGDIVRLYDANSRHYSPLSFCHCASPIPVLP